MFIHISVACKQALLLGQAKRASRERASEGPPFRCPSRLRRSLARSRETRFTRPNRRACLQANISANQRSRVRSWPCGLHESEIQGKVDRRLSLPPRRESLSISRLKKVKKNRKDQGNFPPLYTPKLRKIRCPSSLVREIRIKTHKTAMNLSENDRLYFVC